MLTVIMTNASVYLMVATLYDKTIVGGNHVSTVMLALTIAIIVITILLRTGI